MKTAFRSWLVRIIKCSGATVLGLLILLFLAPYLFPAALSDNIKSFVNRQIKGRLEFSRTSLSFFRHFPSFTFTIHELNLKGSAPFQRDTLIAADELSFGINLRSLIFERKIDINRIFLSHARIAIEVNEQGLTNYDIFNTAGDKRQASPSDSGAALKLEKIVISGSHLSYHDKSASLLADAMGLHYEGNGDLSKELLDLKSHLDIDSLNFRLQESQYLFHKQVHADLVTRINTNSLDFFFEKNDLRINRLPLQFSGRLNFLKSGYAFDLSLHAPPSPLQDFISALPPAYLRWLANTRVSGLAELDAAFKGEYDVTARKMPGFSLRAKLRDGSIANNASPFPLSRAFLDFNMVLPSLNTDSLRIRIDSISFQLDKDYLRGKLLVQGLDRPVIATRAEAKLDLEKLDRALGIGSVRWKGRLDAMLEANGLYARRSVQAGMRKKEQMEIVSIPSFHLRASLTDGYVKYDSLPESLHNISLKLDAACPGHDWKNATFRLDSLAAEFAGSHLHGSGKFSAARDFPMEARLDSKINLTEIGKCIPLDSLDLSGWVSVNLSVAGKYNPSAKIFPVIRMDAKMEQGKVLTKYYPHPVENIQFDLHAMDLTANLKGLQVLLPSASMEFEGKPFMCSVSLRNFEDPLYDIIARGEFDLGKISRVWGKQGPGLSGVVKADLALRGRQSDAVQGRYDRLRNAGTLSCHNLVLRHEYFTKPLEIHEGIFRFEEDKMWFTRFRARYGESDLELDGYLSNAINYFLSNNSMLTGNFNLNAHRIDLDEFTSYADANSGKGGSGGPSQKDSAHTTGVVMIPPTLHFTLKAVADNIRFNGLVIENLNGGIVIDNGQVQLTETRFRMIGCSVLMDGLYGNTSPTRAFFEYHLQATDFDVKRAYREVKLFHDLASSAAKAEGIISLDYHLKGRLSDSMFPVYPSLSGEGVVSIGNVKVNGLKLFNVVSASTEKQELKDPELSKINIHSRIRNNIIYIDRFKFKTAGFRIRVEGQTSFDNMINFRIRIGLPPLGIIGIPVNATGNAENPRIKLGKEDNATLSGVEDKDDGN